LGRRQLLALRADLHCGQHVSKWGYTGSPRLPLKPAFLTQRWPEAGGVGAEQLRPRA